MWSVFMVEVVRLLRCGTIKVVRWSLRCGTVVVRHGQYGVAAPM